MTMECTANVRNKLVAYFGLQILNSRRKTMKNKEIWKEYWKCHAKKLGQSCTIRGNLDTGNCKQRKPGDFSSKKQIKTEVTEGQKKVKNISFDWSVIDP